jgi:hypothetical protein
LTSQDLPHPPPQARTEMPTSARLLRALATGLLLFAALQLTGAFLEFLVRRSFAPTWLIPIPVILLAALVWRLQGRKRPPFTKPDLHRGMLASVLVALCAALPAPDFIYHADYFVPPGSHLLLYKPNSIWPECYGARGCHDHAINRFGLRGQIARRASSAGKIVGLVGDSFIFGSGVDDGQTLAETLQPLLSSANQPVAVANLGIPGANLPSLANIVQYGKSLYQPELFVVLIKSDDLTTVDRMTRLNELQEHLLPRLSVVTNFSTVIEVFRQFKAQRDGSGLRTEELTRFLDALEASAGSSALLLVTDVPALEGAKFDKWLAKHPRTQHVVAQTLPGYETAPRIPGDGHWNASGVQVVAHALAEPIARAMQAAGR